MTGDILVAFLLGCAVVSQLACAVGLFLMRNALDRLHFVGPATIVGPVALAAAVWVARGLDTLTIRALLAMVLLVATGPILSYVMARVIAERGAR